MQKDARRRLSPHWVAQLEELKSDATAVVQMRVVAWVVHEMPNRTSLLIDAALRLFFFRILRFSRVKISIAGMKIGRVQHDDQCNALDNNYLLENFVRYKIMFASISLLLAY